MKPKMVAGKVQPAISGSLGFQFLQILKIFIGAVGHIDGIPAAIQQFGIGDFEAINGGRFRRHDVVVLLRIVCETPDVIFGNLSGAL